MTAAMIYTLPGLRRYLYTLLAKSQPLLQGAHTGACISTVGDLEDGEIGPHYRLNVMPPS